MHVETPIDLRVSSPPATVCTMTIWRPKHVAEKLGVDDSNDVREVLRGKYRDHPKNKPWELNREMVETVGEWNVSRGKTTPEKVEEMLADFDAAQSDVPESVAGPIPGEPPAFEVIDYDGPVCREAERLLECARNGGSVLTDHDVWTDENIEILIECFVKRPDVSGKDFFTKLDLQLEGVADDVRVLFAEIFLLQMLPLMQFLPATKIANIERVLREADGEYEIPAEIIEALESPVFGGGVAFGIRRFQQLSMLIEFVRYLRTLTDEELDRGFEEPLAWREIVSNSPGSPELSLRGSLIYLGHPDYFFPIVAEVDKKMIVAAFFPDETGRPSSGDLDVDLAALREWMSPSPGPLPNFYLPPLSDFWFDVYDEEPSEDEEPDEADFLQYTVESIIEDGAFHAPQELRRIVDRWQSTKNIVLQGAPGTGKTWLARRLAYALIGFKDEDSVRAVQFHPGTSYEDFVRGWRPSGNGTLELVDGPLLQHAELARKHPDIPHVIIIEEFNRGNPAQALGEMLTLLGHTKRTEREALELTYTRDDEDRFYLPENLYVIGTMNTADRSLALVDFALRRRFAFFELEPQFNDSWKAHLRDRFRTTPAGHIDEIARRITAMNVGIAADSSLGKSFRIGHSYFTPEVEASELWPWFEAVVETSVAPQLNEYWHDDPEAVERTVQQLLEEL